MTENRQERFKVILPLHPAFKHTVPVPLALLRHYRNLDLSPNKLTYILLIFATYMNGGEANQQQIADLMGVDARTLRNYNAHLLATGLVQITPRNPNGVKLENDYDFQNLLDEALRFYTEDQLRQERKQQEILEILNEVAETIEAGQPINGSLKTRLLEHTMTVQERPDPESIPKSQVLDAAEEQPSIDEDSSASKTIGLADELVAIGFDRAAATVVLYEAQRDFGNRTKEVILGWIAHVKQNKRIQNPPGFIRAKLRVKAEPPEPPTPKNRIPEELDDIIKR